MKGLCKIITCVCAHEPPIILDETEEGENTITLLLKDLLNEVSSLRKEIANFDAPTLKYDNISLRANKLRSVCDLLPSQIVPIFTLLENIGKVFTVQGWTRKKINSKKESQGLALLVGEFKLLIIDLKNRATGSYSTCEKIFTDVSDFSTSSQLLKDVEFFSSADGINNVKNAINNIVSSHETSTKNIMPFLDDMINIMTKYYEEEHVE